MTKNLKFYLIFLLMLTKSMINSQESDVNENKKSLTMIWETKPVFKTPESVVFDSKRNCLYVSNFNTRGGFVSRNDKTRDEFISRVKMNGEIDDLHWATGLLNPTGLAIYDDSLFVVERDSIVKIDLKNAEIQKRFLIKNTFFLNDITFDNEGTAFITDNSRKVQETSVYNLKNEIVTPFLSKDRVFRPNGINTIGNKIITFDYTQRCLVWIHNQNKNVSKIAELPNINTVDGLQIFSDDEYIISDFAGKIYFIDKTGKTSILFDAKSIVSQERPKINCTDLLFISKEKWIIVPTFFDNRLIAFQINGHLL